MQLARAAWSLAAALSCLAPVVGAAAAAAGVLEIDVVFPRNNATYPPTFAFPIVFALQNAQLAKELRPEFFSFVRNGSGLNETFGHKVTDLTYANFTSDPYLVYYYLTFDTEGPYQLFATATWISCDESGEQTAYLSNSSNFAVDFTIKRGAPEVDLVADTATCTSGQDAVAVSVTDKTITIPSSWSGPPAGTCAVLASSAPSPTTDPCRVKIDTAAAASMSASLHARMCKGLNPPADCPKENNAVQKLVVAAVASLSTALGAIGFLLFA